MNRFVYSSLLYICCPLIWAYLLFRAIKAPEYREGFWQRLGVVRQPVRSGGIVIHCASVGETRAAAPLVEQLILKYPELAITITTTTPTGKEAALALFNHRVTHRYIPIDWPGSCKRFLKSLKPQIVILMETELWPNFVNCCFQFNIPLLLANARLSKKSFIQYQKFPQLSQNLFNQVTKIAAQYPSDKKYFSMLGVKPNKIELVGNIKFDIDISNKVLQQQIQLKKQWANHRPVWVAASIHPREFDIILNTHQQLLQVLPDLLLIAVPRHPEKFAELKELCHKQDLRFISRSDGLIPDKTIQIVVGDTMGELGLFCGIADIAFIGGSLIPRGGHNPLEAIANGVPVITGPSFYNFDDICQILQNHEVMQVVDSVERLSHNLQDLLNDQTRLFALSRKARQIIEENSGCVKRLIEQVQSLIAK